MKVALIGLGRMGSPIARNLMRSGHELTVYNRTPEKAQSLVNDGAKFADSPASACRDCEAVITMLADDAAVEDVVYGQSGIAGGLRSEAVHVSSSTISTAMVRKLAAEHHNRGQGFVSAPVFGRPEAAEAAKLIVVAAGAPEMVERCHPLFDAIGRQTLIAGPNPPQANAVKLCGNFMIASMIESFGEAYATLRKSGVDPHLFLDAMSELFGSPVYKNYGGIIADEKFEPAGFALKLGLKDARLVLDTAQECSSPMPIASLVRDHLLAAMAHGDEDLDWSSVARVSARNAGL